MDFKNEINHCCKDVWGVKNIKGAFSNSFQSLEWDDRDISVQSAEVFECISLCHSLNIFFVALSSCRYPQDGICMSDFLRYYICKQWEMPSYFYNSKVWKDVFSMYTGKTLAPDVVYIMAFVDFMSNMCFPVVVRLYIGRKMVGKPHVISPEVTNQLNEVDLGAHYTLDLCFLDGIFCLMKTSDYVCIQPFFCFG